MSQTPSQTPSQSRVRRPETEPPGITYDRFRAAALLERVRKRLDLKRVIEVPSTAAKACPSLYSVSLAMAGVDVTLVNPFPPAFEGWRRLGVAGRLSSVQARPDRLPFRADSFDLAWNFVTLGREEALVPSLIEMTRVAPAVLLVQQNAYNVGYPWHRFLHWLFGLKWDHGHTRYFFPRTVSIEMNVAGLDRLEVGLLDQAPWPDPPGFRDVRLHFAGTQAHPEEDCDWTVPAVEYFRSGEFPGWMRFLGMVEELPVPLFVRWPVNHLFYVLGFRAGANVGPA